MTAEPLPPRIPGLGVIRRRDLARAAIRRARLLRGSPPDELLLDTWIVPEFDEQFESLREQEPTRRFVLRPATTTRGAPETELSLDDVTPQHGGWVAQEYLPELAIGGRAVRARLLGVVVALDPLVLYALPGPFGFLADGEEAATASPPRYALAGLGREDSVIPERVARQLAELLADGIEGLRELLLVRQRVRGEAGPYQVVGVTALLDGTAAPRFLELEATPLSRWQVPASLADEIDAAAAEIASMATPPAQHARLVRAVPGADESGLSWPRVADRALRGTPGSAVSPSPDVRSWLLGDDLVLHTAHRGDLLVVSGSGAYVWAALNEGVELPVVTGELAAATGVESAIAEAAIEDLLAAWVEAGVVTRDARPALPDMGRPARSVSFQPGSGSGRERHYRLGGAAIRVIYPGAAEAEWADRALAGLADGASGEVIATVHVEARGEGYILRGSEIGARRCPSPYGLPARVRSAVVASWSRVVDAPAWQATALALPGGSGCIVVVGRVSERAALVEEWLEQGGNVLADDLVVLGERGVVMPTAVGFAERPTYQWIDGLTPSWGRADAPVVDEEGYLVDYRVLEEAAYASAPLPALIVAIGGAEGGPVGVPTGDALRALLQTRVAGRRAVSEREAGDTVAWLAAASSVRVNLTEPARAARSLRELLTALTADK